MVLLVVMGATRKSHAVPMGASPQPVRLGIPVLKHAGKWVTTECCNGSGTKGMMGVLFNKRLITTLQNAIVFVHFVSI